MNTTHNTPHEHDELDELDEEAPADAVDPEVQTARLRSLRDEGEDIVVKAAAYAASLVAEANITLRQRRKDIAAAEADAAEKRSEMEAEMSATKAETARLTAQKDQLQKEIDAMERTKRLTALTNR